MDIRRIFIIAYFISQSLGMPDESTNIDDLNMANYTVSHRVFMLIIMFVLVTLLVYSQLWSKANKMPSQKWKKPGWTLNPFQFNEPIHFFHLCGYCAVILGGVGIFRSVFYGPPIWFLNLFILLSGLGLLLAVQLVQVSLPEKFEEYKPE